MKLSPRVPTNAMIIRDRMGHGTWPKGAVIVELRNRSRWLMMLPDHQAKTWSAGLFEPDSKWKKVIKEGMTKQQADRFVNLVLRDETMYKDDTRKAACALITKYINNII